MHKGWLIVWLLAVIIIIGAIILFVIPAPSANAPTGSTTDAGQATTTASGTAATTTPQTGTVSQHPDLSDMVVVDSPKPQATVTSPLVVTGKARGGFYFEAVFPVKLLDAKGNVIAQGPATAQGEWMTQDFVPFTAKLTFTKPAAGTTGTLQLMNDNPSGDPDKQVTLEIPVKF